MNVLRKRNLIVVLGIIAGLMLILFYGPSLRILHLQTRAGRVMEDFYLSNGIKSRKQFTCLIPLIQSFSEIDQLQEAVLFLNKANSIDPNHPQTHLLLGRIHCLSGDYANAIEEFKIYSQLKPSNPLGTMELAFAIYASEITTSPGNVEAGSDLSDGLFALFQSVNISPDDFSAHARHAFRIGDFESACMWYGLSDVMMPLDDISAYRHAVLNLLFLQLDESLELLPPGIIISVSESPVSIPLDAYFRLDNGDQVPIQEKAGQEAAILYSKHEDARVFVKILNSGCYRLSLPALDTPPAPILIDVIIDFESITQFQLENGDNSWQVFETALFLEEGYHLVGFRLENDTKFDGLDRNAMIGSLTISPCEN